MVHAVQTPIWANPAHYSPPTPPSPSDPSVEVRASFTFQPLTCFDLQQSCNIHHHHCTNHHTLPLLHYPFNLFATAKHYWLISFSKPFLLPLLSLFPVNSTGCNTAPSYIMASKVPTPTPYFPISASLSSPNPSKFPIRLSASPPSSPLCACH